MIDTESHEPPAVAKLRSLFGDVLVDAVRTDLILEDTPEPFDLPAEKMVILPFGARSGSTYATQLLSGHPAFGTVTDWFLPRRLKQVQEKSAETTHHQIAQRFLREKSGRIFASKCNRESLIAAAYLGILDQFIDHITFFVIDRKDKVAQAVSFHKARVSGRFHSSQEQRTPARPEDFDFDAIHLYYQRYQEISDQLMALGVLFGRPIQRFWYEDFSRDPDAFLNAVNSALALPARTGFKTETRVQKLSDTINEEWAERFRVMLAERESV